MAERNDIAFEDLLEAAPDALVGVDPDGRITFANTQAARLFGYARQELVGLDVEALVPQAARGLHAGQRARYLRNPVPRPMGVGMELAARRRDGSEFPAEISLKAVRRAGGALVVAAVRDIGERLRAQREAEQLRAEAERRRIAADVHDDAVQVMTAVGFRLEVLRRSLDDPAQAAAAARLQDAVSLSIGRLRSLLCELSPPTLMSRGLGDAVRGFLEQQRDWEVEWRVEEDLVEQPPGELRTLLYRICQEALVNVRKHAGRCTVLVRIVDHDGGVRLEVRDSGRGSMVGDAGEAEVGHLGLSGMRERATQAGGWWRFESAPRRGTRVLAWVPLPAAVAHG